MDKVCTKCREPNPLTEFIKASPKSNSRSKDGLHPWCKTCRYEAAKRNNRENRQKLYDLYGRVCGRCGFDDERAFQIDHINSDGYLHRALIGENKVRFTKDVLANPERFQLLCANCNAIKKVEKKEVRQRG